MPDLTVATFVDAALLATNNDIVKSTNKIQLATKMNETMENLT